MFQKHIKNGGAIPKADSIRQNYLPPLHEKKVSEFKAYLEQADSYSLVFDEQCDISHDLVFHILAVPESRDGSLNPLLIASEYLDETNSVTVSQTIVRVCNEWSLSFNKVSALVSDGAAYCAKAYNDALKGLFPNAVHLVCNAHILSLVSDQWRSEFQEVDMFCIKMKRVFAHSVARKRRFREHLVANGCPDPRNPPAPVVTRWSSWYNAVAYHSGHFKYYKEFFEQEKQEHNSATVIDVCAQLDSPFLQEELHFIAVHCARPQAVLTSFETKSASLHSVYDTVSDLLAWARTMALSDLSEDEELNARFKGAFKRTEEKLGQYYAPSEYSQTGRTARYTQHALPLLKAVRALDPGKAPFLSKGLEEVQVLPGFGTQETVEYKMFLSQCQGVGSIDIIPYWHSLEKRYPALTRLALRYLSVPVGSVDAERSFSSRGNILTPQRMNLTPENRSKLTFLYVNA